MVNDANVLSSKLSGGMKRKVLLARTLITNPSLLILDEPTAGIDIFGARMVRSLIKRMVEKEDKTVVITSHDLLDIQELCTRVGIMVDGEIKLITTPDEMEEGFKASNLEELYIKLVTGEL